jgi:hypothetical protein
MAVPQEPLEMLEPDNLLEPMDLTDAQSAGGHASTPDRRERVPLSEDRMLPGDPSWPRAPLRRHRKRRFLTVGLLAVGAAACIGIGVALPELARHSGAMHQPTDTAAGAAVASAPANDPAPQSTNDRPAAAPCHQQTWPNLGRDCLKGADHAAPADPSPMRAILPDRNPDGSLRTTSPAAHAPPAKPTPAANAAAPGTNEQALAGKPVVAGNPVEAGKPVEAAKPVEAEKTAAAVTEPPERAERRARETRREARRAARRDRAQQRADASGAARPREDTANAANGDDPRSGEDAETSRQVEPSWRNERSSRDRRANRYRTYRYRDRDSVGEADSRDRGVDRRDDDRSYQRPAPDSGRRLLIPGFARDRY